MRLIGCTISSAALLLGGVLVSLLIFGIQECWSYYGALWGERYSDHGSKPNLWSIINIVSAMFLIPPTIESLSGMPYQCLGFGLPLLLFLVGLTPDYRESKIKNIVHQTGAWGCTLLCLIYLLLIKGMWIPTLCVMGITCIIVTVTPLRWKGWQLWFEIAMFILMYMSMYMSL